MNLPEQRIDVFEEWLRATGSTLQYPPTPPLSGRVAARLRTEPPRQRSNMSSPFSGLLPNFRWGLGVGLALALVVLALGVSVALSPPMRTALADFFGLERIEVVPIQSTPSAPPSLELPSGFEGVAGVTSLAEARSQADFPVRVPSYPEGLGEPDSVYFQDLKPGQQIILVYQSRADLGLGSRKENDIRFALFQFRTQGIFQKQVYPDTLIEELKVAGVKALWFQGAAHILQYRNAEGDVKLEFRRMVKGNTLAWEVGEVTYRLETMLPKEEAIKIAESLR
ncbi:MAG: DUF4367 domain-containing protein [Dehalococcoidia bacterium]